ncbi:MAG: dethiobiotin synthase [Planctomycetes bacterium GWF2_41_51]|nr:MAG: dethiobiotin synthase [Planctomycetes bacterium GWF2_41_51]
MGFEILKHKGLFITATDTGVGKTLIAGAIAKILSEKGKKIGVFKPVATGCKKTREGLVGEDAEFLALCSDSEFSLADINPETFEEPAAPYACEIKESRKVDLERIITAYNYICSNSDYIIVEGIGGVRVPITENLDVLGLAKMFGLPVVVVARPGLGTINHTLLTIDAIRNAQLPLAGIIINGYDEPNSDFAQQSAPAIIAEVGRTRILAVVPYDEQVNIGQGEIGNIVPDSLSDIDWLRIIEQR